MKPWVKTIFVILGAVVFSTVAIQANDIVRGIEGNLMGSVLESDRPCDEGALLLNNGAGALCVDIYEASPATDCEITNPRSGQDTQTNLNNTECMTESASDKTPWRYVSLAQAQQLCARSGKRLPSNEEWYALAVGQVETSSCVLQQSSPRQTGVSQCVTTVGIHDVIGNVWEWTNAEVVAGTYNGRTLPDSGFVAVVDTAGVVVETSATPNEAYGEDYAKTNADGVYGVIRGGFYDSRSDGGVYAQNLAVPLNLQTDGVGFRCVRNL